MKKSVYFLAVAMIMMATSCTKASVITQKEFGDIMVGMPFEEVQTRIGEEYDVTRTAPDTLEYRYIERIEHGPRGGKGQRHYILIVKDGAVESKSYKEFDSPLNIYSD